MSIRAKSFQPYAELQTTTNFTFLEGGAHPREMVIRADELGLHAIGITDCNSLAGVVRAFTEAQNRDIRVVYGARLVLTDGPDFLCYPTDLAAYGRLSRLLSLGKMAAEKGSCLLSFDDLIDHAEGQILIALPPLHWTQVDLEDGSDFIVRVKQAGKLWRRRVYLALCHRYQGQDRERLAQLNEVARRLKIQPVAVNDVLYHIPSRRPLQDIVTCIREHCTIADAGYRLEGNFERHLKSPQEMARLFQGFEDAISNTIAITEKCRFCLGQLSYDYPDEPVPKGKSPQEHLTDLSWKGAHWRYPDGIPRKVQRQVHKELQLIRQLKYAPYFLTVHDIVAWARNEGILCQGRGSAANSAVCFCLGVTSVDPTEQKLLFERFINAQRKEPPDIDVDFEHERREEVIQYIYRNYGRDRAALTATVISYRPRSAVREVCKALGLSEDISSALAGTVWGSFGREINDQHIRNVGLDPLNPVIRMAVILTRQLIGFPRHLSQHVGGFVLTKGPLVETVPIGNAAMKDRTFIEWDKDDLDALKIMKVDVLALGMLTCIRKCFDLIDNHYGKRLDLADIPRDDPAVYDMLCNADSLGVFQVESRAQMSMLPRLKPRSFYDLVIEVAIVRPGPIQGDMVHPYLRRRNKHEDVTYPRPLPEHGPADELENILKRTLGVPLFQEQAMQIAMDAAKFTPDEANGLRRSMATFRKLGTIGSYEEKLVKGMVKRGYDEQFAKRCFDQIKGFGDYGFPESHAASFALLVYISSWIKCHYPDVFCTGLLNAQPMGFYAPAQIVRDAREHGVKILAVDVNYSDWDNTLERDENNQLCMRMGLRQVDGIGKENAEIITRSRAEHFESVHALWRRTRIGRDILEKLAAADGFRSIGLDRRQALWNVRALPKNAPLPLFAHADLQDTGIETTIILPQMPLSEHVVQDYQTTRLSLKAHPISFLRDDYTRRGATTAVRLASLGNNSPVRVAGLVLVRQRPGTANGVVFITIEDETGIANLIVWGRVMERYRSVVMGARVLAVEGFVQSADNVTHVIVDRLYDRTHDLDLLSEGMAGIALDRSLMIADEVIAQPVKQTQLSHTTIARTNRWCHPRNVQILPKSRDFH